MCVTLNTRSDGAPKRSVAGTLTSGARRRRGLFVLRVRLEDPVAHGVLRRRVADRTEQREAPALAVDGILPRGKRHVPAGAASALPHGEAGQLEPVERAGGEVEFRVGELARRVAFVVGLNRDRHLCRRHLGLLWFRDLRFLHDERNPIAACGGSEAALP